MSPAVQYKKGRLQDLMSLRMAAGLSVTAESIEFNVLGAGHEFWVAEQGDVVIGVAVVAKENEFDLRVLHLEVAPIRKNEGVGSGILKAVIENYPLSRLWVTPFEGTEEFYGQLGFVRVGRWEMKREPTA